MGKIKVLDKNVVAKISAGEVIDCVASAIKELIENSIDANAKHIKIEIEALGLDKIQVTDDGDGMEFDDLKMCYKAHSTSKIFYEDDLISISTLGFRGEALASIAAISTMYIKSRTRELISGGIIELREGKLVRESEIGMPVGTSIVVKDLYEAIPARKKFLKSSRVEAKKILDVIVNFALCYPNVGFFFASNKKIKIDLPSEQSLLDRVRLLLGTDFARNLLPLEYEDQNLTFSGYFGSPKLVYPNKNRQFLFVNNRIVRNNLISNAVRDAYGTLLMARDQPTFVLFLNLSPSVIDVNIHPRKEEVSFASSLDVHKTVCETVSKHLNNENLGYVFDTIPANDLEYELSDDNKIVFHDELSTDYQEAPILQINNMYLMLETKKGLVLFDQHAVHERILYENLLDAFSGKNTGVKKKILDPVLIEFSLSEAEILKEYTKLFDKLGYEIEEFGHLTFKISSTPYFIPDNNVALVVREIVEDLVQEKPIKNIDQKTDRAISYVACKSAIKAGDYLTIEERKNLLDDLSKTKTAYTCPHGRPVKLEITWNELARMFRRK